MPEIRVPLTKAHGAKNTYLIVDEFGKVIVPEELKPEFVRQACADNKLLIDSEEFPSDGVLFVQKATKRGHDLRYRMFNPDGSEAEMCGNGMRCFAKYVFEKGIMKKRKFRVQAKARTIIPEITKEGLIKVDMGKPVFESKKIPVLTKKKRFVDQPVVVNGSVYRVTAVSMGNPHAIVQVDGLDDFDVEEVGRKIRSMAIFPEGVNVTFFQKIGKNRLTARTYERGVERETHACGTGITACAAAACLLKVCNKKKPVEISAKGGMLQAVITPKTAYLTGTAELLGETDFIFKYGTPKGTL